MEMPELLARIQAQTNGARFYKCALQVNPWAYVQRHYKPSTCKTEEEYNTAIVEALRAEKIDVVGLTDHNSVTTSEALRAAAESNGITVFPGFELTTKDGIHWLVLYDPTTDIAQLQLNLGSCGIVAEGDPATPSTRYDSSELLDDLQGNGCVCIAAHITQSNGLLNDLTKGVSRVVVWSNPRLWAVEIPGTVVGLDQKHRSIVDGGNQDYNANRPGGRPPAAINAADVFDPSDIEKRNCWTLIKMQKPSIEGLRQAFLDAESRVRLKSDTASEAHDRIEAVCFSDGFLSGAGIHFNKDLNALIGGRGTGKSTVIEGIRFALGQTPLAEELRKNHDGIVKGAIRAGTTVSLVVATHQSKATPAQYIIRRTVGQRPIVYDDNDAETQLAPSDVMESVDILGQHEIAVLASDSKIRTQILKRFLADKEPGDAEVTDVRRRLADNRQEIAKLTAEITRIDDQLKSLPALHETLKRFQKFGAVARLEDRRALEREERILQQFAEQTKQVLDQLADTAVAELLDDAFLSDAALASLPGRDILARLRDPLAKLREGLLATIASASIAITTANEELECVRSDWQSHKLRIDEAYQEVLRELQRDKIDGSEYVETERRIQQLEPLRQRKSQLSDILQAYLARRNELVTDLRNREKRDLDRYRTAAKHVSAKLKNRVEVIVESDNASGAVLQVISDVVGGRLAETQKAIKSASPFDRFELARTCREGSDALNTFLNGIPCAQAASISAKAEELCPLLDEAEPVLTTTIKLNIAEGIDPPQFRPLDQLSTGQKATAILLVLLLEGKTPLIVDQPEDDLDNRFVSEQIVQTIRQEKQRRQFILATHNANIPVNGDAELIVALTPAPDGASGSERMRPEDMGAIDDDRVRALAERILEGGRAAFEQRRAKYGF